MATNKDDELSILCSELDPDILVVSETGFSQTTKSHFQILNYNLVNTFCREKQKGGGVGIFTKLSTVTSNWELPLATEKHFEITGIKLSTKNYKLHIIGLYRSPSGDEGVFFQQFEALLNGLLSDDVHFILLGDFNIDVLDQDDKMTKRFKDVLTTFGLTWSVNTPTRVTPTSKTAIDNVISNIPNIITTVVCTAISDHDAQQVVVTDCQQEKKLPVVSIQRDLYPENIALFNAKLSKERWNFLQFPTFNDKFEAFNDTLLFNLNTFCPLKNKKQSQKRWTIPWITSGILVSRERIKFLSIIAKKSQNIDFKNYFKKYKQIYKKVIRAAKAYDTCKTLKSSPNLAKTAWKIINSKSNSTKSNQIKLKIENVFVSSPVRVANEFNKFFSEVAGCNNQLSAPYSVTYDRSPADSMMLAPVTEQEVAHVIQQLPSKKTYDTNYMSTWLIKKCVKNIVSPLTALVNDSFQSGIFPNALKKAKVVPILKKDDPHLINNYRPISILPVFSKIFEKLFLTQLLKFLEKYNLLSKDQFGFRAGKSTTDAVMSLVDLIVEGIENKEHTLSVFLDLSKAFDCVDHQILLQKLNHYGVRGVPLAWLDSYLNNRTQYVSISVHSSSNLKLKYGVPQGSILSPLLFLIYVNDVGSALQYGHLVQYADDMTLLYKSVSTELLEMQSFLDLNSCIQHFRKLNLNTNSSKTNYLQFCLRPEALVNSPVVMVDNTVLQEVESAKFLGIYFDRSLTWTSHVDHVCAKVSSGVYALRKLSTFCPTQILLMAYFGLIYPHLTYGIPVWGGCSTTQFLRIFRLQKKAVRIISKLNSRESCKPAFIELRLLTLPCLYILETTLLCMTKCHLMRGSDIHTYETRGRDNYRRGQHRTAIYERLPSQAGATFINSLPDAMKNVPVPQALKVRLKSFLTQKAFYSVGEFLQYNWES